MTIPLLALLGFALWTLLILFAFVGPYRWVRILSGRTRASHWTADPNAGAGLYPRAMRAHMNCIENLPVFGTIVYVIDRVGLESLALDALALIVLGARIRRCCANQLMIALALSPDTLIPRPRSSGYRVP
ncbi:MAPEG family protein [Paracoccus binzhouensis]|uniref:MAPEG family protein n=1 Tax=Paracoccus binzhouensis TaxID=2796149 RepID=UPI0018EF1AC4|nr:MAPEG family protein [Paracoccus binzhouensis]